MSEYKMNTDPTNEQLYELLRNLFNQMNEMQTHTDKVIFLALNGTKEELHQAILDYRLKFPPNIQSDDDQIKDES